MGGSDVTVVFAGRGDGFGGVCHDWGGYFTGVCGDSSCPDLYGAQGMCFFSVPCRTESCGALGIDTEFCGYDQDADEGVDYD